MKEKVANKDKDMAEAMQAIAALQTTPGSKAENMPEQFYAWLCETLQADLADAQARLARAIELRCEAEKIRAAAALARDEAVVQFGAFRNEQNTPALQNYDAASRAWARAREVEQFARIHGRDCLIRLDRARVGVQSAQAMIADTWKERPLLTFDVDAVATADVREAAARPGVSIVSRLRGVYNSWLGRGEQ